MLRQVLTLVGSRRLGTETVAAAGEVLRRGGAAVGEADWLAAARACDVPCDGVEAAAVAEPLQAMLAGEGVDFAVLPAEGRRKRVLVADMEATVIRNEMLDELADFAGIRPQVARITARAMNGELDFAAALRARVALLAGLPATVLERALERIELDPGARTLVATMHRHGAYTALVSGGFSYFTERVRAELGFDVQQSNELLIADGRLTGEVREPILDRDAKLAALHRLCAEHGATPADALAVGDGANDLPMLAAAGLGVAFRAKPRVAAAARVRVVHGDLTALLFFQGYRADDVSPGR